MHIDLDIIIVNYCSTNHTIKCLGSIYSKEGYFNPNVIVVDNCSNDQPERITEQFSEVMLFKSCSNLGFGKAVNLAIENSSAPIVVLLNPDTFLLDGFFEKVYNVFMNNPNIGILGPRILDDDGSIQGSARRFPTPLTSIFGRKSPLTRLFPNNHFTKREFICFNQEIDKAIDVDWVSGACMVVRRNAFQSINGFDTRFFLYWEDTDLCKRMKDDGWKVLYLPDAHITHLAGKSSSKKPFFSTYHFHRSCYYLFLKHSRMPMKMMAPIAFFGLSMRALVIMLVHFMQKRLKKIRKKT